MDAKFNQFRLEILKTQTRTLVHSRHAQSFATIQLTWYYPYTRSDLDTVYNNRKAREHN